MSETHVSQVIAALRRTRIWLAVGIAARALLWAAAIGACAIALIALVDVFVAIPVALRRAAVVATVALTVGVFAALLWRDRRARRLSHVALWIEERVPELRFALVTELESAGNASLVSPSAARPWPRMARARATRALGFPLAALVAAAAALLLLPAGSLARAAAPKAGDSVDRTPAGRVSADVNRLEPLAVEIEPPSYSGRPVTRLDDPSTIRALPGSRVSLVGRGSPAGVVARLGNVLPARLLHATPSGAQWRIELTTEPRAVAVTLSDGLHARIVDLEPEPDAAPTVALRAPIHDSVLASPHGTIPLLADAADDIGLATARFEVIVSAGEGETFTFRTLTLGARTLTSTSARMSAMLSLDAARVGPGDVLHVRAVVADGNTATGPGIGTSDTRVLRIARPGEGDTTSITPAAPPDTNQSALSERMLIQLTEALQRKLPGMPRPALLTESHSIAADQQRLRRTVGDLVFARLGGQASGEERTPDQNDARSDTLHDLLARADRATNQSIQTLDFDGGESPVVAVNAPLLEAYNAMWEAGGALEQGELQAALPHMRTALAAIERSRAAERVYLRGRAPDVVVDVARARLAGTEHGASSLRVPRPVVDTSRTRLATRFDALVSHGAAASTALADSLLLLRIDALSDQPAFAAALGDAAAALRTRRPAEATDALLRARRALAGPIRVRQSLGAWFGAGE